MADVFTFFIRFLHILSGVMWIGGASLWVMVIAPNVLQRGPPMIRRPFLEAVLARYTRYILIAASLTIITGFWVMGLLVGFADIPEAFQSASYGTALGIGAVLAIIMYLLGVLFIMPTAKKLLAIMQSMPAPTPGAPPAAPPAELAALGKKLGIAGLLSLTLGMIALGAMVWAVNTVR